MKTRIALKATCIISAIAFVMFVAATLIIGFRDGFLEAPVISAVYMLINGTPFSEIPMHNITFTALFIAAPILFFSTVSAFKRQEV